MERPFRSAVIPIGKRKKKERKKERIKRVDPRTRERLDQVGTCIRNTPFDLYFVCFFLFLCLSLSVAPYRRITRKCVSGAPSCLRALYFSPAPSRRRRLTHGGAGRKSYIMYDEFREKLAR